MFLSEFSRHFRCYGEQNGGGEHGEHHDEHCLPAASGYGFLHYAIAVLAGAISGLLTEFGVVALINRLLSSLMEPLYHLPGASILGVLATYLSDNPVILTLADDSGFRCFFKKYQLPALTN